jgi:Protein of unknown function (DUF4232)
MVAGMTALAVMTASCSDDQRAASSTSSAVSVVPQTSGTPVPTTQPTTFTPASSTTVSPSSTVPENVVEVVPWVAAPARVNQRLEFAVTLPTELRTAPPCSVKALQVVPSADGALGTIYGLLEVHNISDTACEVQGVPFIELLDTEDRIVHSTDPSNVEDKTPPVVLVPNSWVQAILGGIASNTCGGGQSATIRVRWHDGVTTQPLEVGRPPDPASCPGIQDRRTPGDLQQPGTGFAPAFAAIPSTPDYVQSALTTTIVAPPSARAGQVLNFAVQMLNSSENQTVFVSGSCPIYEAALSTAKITMFLNCGGIGGAGILIPSGSGVRFEMQLQIPADVPTGPQTLTWTWAEPAGRTATATVDVLS